MKKLSTIFCQFICICSFAQKISGRLKDVATNKPLSNGNVFLLKPEKTKDTVAIYYWENKKFKIVQSTTSNSLGYYSFNTILPDTYTIVAEFLKPPIGHFNLSVYEQSIDSNVNIKYKANYVSNFKLPVTCKFEKTSKQLFCPVCKKANKVIPIAFGLPNFDSLGNIPPTPEVYYAGCFIDIYCHPTKYCKRCKRLF